MFGTNKWERSFFSIHYIRVLGPMSGTACCLIFRCGLIAFARLGIAAVDEEDGVVHIISYADIVGPE